ncbi:MAG: 4Fe-4S binding protein [Omnitrophica bacterium]|nr:4Fe-4S binding protein [Candidatus Omnitrophota bacterium]
MVDLFEKIPFLKKIVKLRAFQFAVIFPNFFLFYLFLIAALVGTPVGNRNIMIVFVWIFWWVMLIAFMVPFASRIWCTVCPLPIIGEWLQRRTLVKVREGSTIPGFKQEFFGLNKQWPKRWRNIWLQNIGFLLLACFSAHLVTRPIFSVFVLGGMIVLSTILALIYRFRAFCMYICPVSGFLGLYAMTSKLALRRKDKAVCDVHKGRECFLGSERSYPCSWFQNICTMDRNNYCGLCMECVKSCPDNNVGLFWRPFCSDVDIKGIDEAWKSFIMLCLAFVYSVNLLGPWGVLKDWANFTETGQWPGFILLALGIILLCMVIFPATYYLFIKWSKALSRSKNVTTKDLFIKYSYAFVPLGLLVWIAFSVPLIMINGSYIIAVISDPLGWGWNIFGTTHFPWKPLLPEWVPYIQIPLLLMGLFYSIKSLYKIGMKIFSEKEATVRSLIPMAILLSLITIVFLRLYVG